MKKYVIGLAAGLIIGIPFFILGISGFSYLERYMKPVSLKFNFVCFLAVSLGVGCGAPKPFSPDDRVVIINLERKFVRDNAEKKAFFGESKDKEEVWDDSEYEKDGTAFSGVSLGPAGDFILLSIIVVGAGVISMKYLEGTHVYIYPEGWPGYRQKISWGENKVYIPSKLTAKHVRFKVEIEGNYKGKGAITVLSRQGRAE